MFLKFVGITGKLRKINAVIYGNGGILQKQNEIVNNGNK
jgi:hypothetical protein